MGQSSTLILFLFLIFSISLSFAAKPKPCKGKKCCKGKDGNSYHVGASYVKKCTKYTCMKKGRKFIMVESEVSGCGCFYDGSLYLPGEVVFNEDIGPCSTKSLKCVKNGIAIFLKKKNLY